MWTEFRCGLLGLRLPFLRRRVLLLKPERGLLLDRLFPVAFGHRLLMPRLRRHRLCLPFNRRRAEATGRHRVRRTELTVPGEGSGASVFTCKSRRLLRCAHGLAMVPPGEIRFSFLLR